MQKPIGSILASLLLLFAFAGCDNELNVAADWEEIAVIYGTLDPVADTQFIRIQRAYLDENEGALAFSLEQDSLYFDTLEVKLDEFHNGVLSKTIELKRINGNDIGLLKDEGVFSYQNNFLYYTTEPIKAPNSFNEYAYALNVSNPRTGYSASAITETVGNAEMQQPVNEFNNELRMLNIDNHSLLARYQEGKFARSYDMTMEMRIEEVDRNDTSNRITKTLTWKMLNGKVTRSLRGFEEAAYLVSSASFFNFLSANLERDSTVYRRLVGCDLRLFGVGEELYNYINVNSPSIGIVQKKPEYTNIENGFGIFSSRHINLYRNQEFHPDTKQAVINNEATRELGFVTF
jgi:hypothetical protein